MQVFFDRYELYFKRIAYPAPNAQQKPKIYQKHQQHGTHNYLFSFIFRGIFILLCWFDHFQSVTLHTDVGDIKIELFCEDCPKTCENFLALCASDYYNNSLFHRNIKGFIVQTGDPTGTGKGGNSIWNRKFEDEFKDNIKHTDRGMLSMANSGPNTNASQFFFTYAAQPHLDLKYTLFGMYCRDRMLSMNFLKHEFRTDFFYSIAGRIIDGFDALDELEKLPVNPKTYKPLVEKRINSVTIHANPLAA